MVIKSGPWGVITAYKVIKQLPCRAGTLEPGAWSLGPRSQSYPGATKAQCPRPLGLAPSCLEVAQMLPGWLGAVRGEPGRVVEGMFHPS